MGNIIAVHSSFEVFAGKDFYKVRQRNDPSFCTRIELCPVSKMFFRPEEKHLASRVGQILHPFWHGKRYVPDDSFRIDVLDDPVLYFNPDRLTAIQAGGIDLDSLPGEKPADRQRFECSLPEPFLLAIDSEPELGGEVVERCERGNEIRIRE